MENCKEITKCLCCESDNLRLILDLGNQSPANNYNVKDKFPLRLNVCLDCSHAQLSHSVNPEILFKDYPYMSGVSETMKRYYKSFAEEINETYERENCRHELVWDSVYEVACNDGAQLDEFKKLGYKTYGIDPAENLVPIAKEKGHDVRCAFFPDDLIRTYDIIVAQNVLAHNDNPCQMLMEAKKRMHKDSILCVQTSQAKMIENHQFDTIYHEHISFFNKRSFSKLFNRCDLEVIEHKFLPDIHGGSDLYILKKMPEISILDYSDFSNRSYKFAGDFKNKVEELQKEGYAVLAYGAAAKMINLIRFTGVKLDGVIDDTPTKKHKRIGLLLICPFKDIETRSTDKIAFIPVWNFYDEIKAKVEKEYPGKFKFIKYIPEIIIE